MDTLNAIIRRALIVAICTTALIGIWQPYVDTFVRVCATMLFSLFIAACLLTRIETEPKRVPIVERKPAPQPIEIACEVCNASLSDIAAGLDCKSVAHRVNARQNVKRAVLP